MKPSALPVLLLLCLPSPFALGADVFYEQRLVAGKAAFATRQYVDAAAELRIAAFGLLDEPKRLLETLAMLALAESALGRHEDVETVLKRFVEVESKFGVWDGSVLDAALRNQFDSLLIRAIPKQTLSSVRSLAVLVAPKLPPAPSRTSARRSAQQPAPVPEPAASPRTESREEQPAAAARRPAEAERTETGRVEQARAETSRAVAPVPVPPAPQPETRQTSASSRAMTDAATLISARRYAEAVTVLSQAVGADRSNRDLRIALMHAAALAKNWPVAAAQVPLVNPFRDNEPVSMFYAAITLYETGQLTSARQMLRRALPRLTSSPLVEEYTAKINGDASGF